MARRRSAADRVRYDRIAVAEKLVEQEHGKTDEVLPSFFGGDLIVDVKQRGEWIARYVCPADNIDVALSREA